VPLYELSLVELALDVVKLDFQVPLYELSLVELALDVVN